MFEMERSQVRRGQMQTLKRLSFCWRVMEVLSTLCSMADSLVARCSLVSAEVKWMATGAPKNRKVVSPKYIGNGLVTEGEVGAVGPPSGRFDGNPHTLGDIGLHARPGQPQLSEAEQMLVGGGPITNE